MANVYDRPLRDPAMRHAAGPAGIFTKRGAEGRQDGSMDADRTPSVQLWAAVQQHLYQSFHAHLLTSDAGGFGSPMITTGAIR
jgi:hypothetical protein